MREIKFRGISIDARGVSQNTIIQLGKFLCGDFVRDEFEQAHIRIHCEIQSGYMDPPEPGYKDIQVDPKTVGQCTGLRDRNEREVYEGDIISFRFISKDGVDYLHGSVIMDEYMWCVDAVDGEIYSINGVASPSIIGNIHEHPEMIN